MDEPPLENINHESLISHFSEKICHLNNNLKNTNDLLLKEILNGQKDKYYEIYVMLKDYEAILFHKNIALCQRIAYNDGRKKLETLRGKILIEVDFKQKFVIGMSPRQVSGEFYNQTQRTCLGWISKRVF